MRDKNNLKKQVVVKWILLDFLGKYLSRTGTRAVRDRYYPEKFRSVMGKIKVIIFPHWY